jgi:REP element-mobilizing transposase RayT
VIKKRARAFDSSILVQTAEVEGGLYHIIARSNNRRVIFHDNKDFDKFLSLLSVQKAKLGFYLYAFCLMSNHFHLLVEQQAERVRLSILRFWAITYL